MLVSYCTGSLGNGLRPVKDGSYVDAGPVCDCAQWRCGKKLGTMSCGGEHASLGVIRTSWTTDLDRLSVCVLYDAVTIDCGYGTICETLPPKSLETNFNLYIYWIRLHDEHMELQETFEQKFSTLLGYSGERQRRIAAASRSAFLGPGGVTHLPLANGRRAEILKRPRRVDERKPGVPLGRRSRQVRAGGRKPVFRKRSANYCGEPDRLRRSGTPRGEPMSPSLDL